MEITIGHILRAQAYISERYKNKPSNMTDLDKEIKFLEELSSLLNRYCKDVECNTPDYILAEHLGLALKAITHTNMLLNHHNKS